jgi:hypothetical protein
MDKVLETFFGTNAKYGVLLEFGGGSRPSDEPFKAVIWDWSIMGVFMIRFTGMQEVEDDLRTIVDIMTDMFLADHTLGGISPWIDFQRIDTPEPSRVNDVPVYWLPFEIMAYEKRNG